jgi:phosphoribosylaminoimidazolecarboxamide formyltransferase/IMP cyclohydrolase
VVAPGCTPQAQEILAAKSKVRVLISPDMAAGPENTVKAIAGGFLVQAADDVVETPTEWQVVTQKQPTPDQLEELLFAWKICKHVKSNAIVVTRDRATCRVAPDK